MKKIMTAAVAASLVGTSAFAGGLAAVAVEPEPAAPVVVVANDSSSKGLFGGVSSGSPAYLLLVGVPLLALLPGSDGSDGS